MLYMIEDHPLPVRPPKKESKSYLTPEEKMQLEIAFAAGASRKDACLFAGVTVDKFSYYMKVHPEYQMRLDSLKESPVMKARQTVVDDLDNVETAKWYLQRKRKDEFSERYEATGKDGAPILVLPPSLIEKNRLIEAEVVPPDQLPATTLTENEE